MVECDILALVPDHPQNRTPHQNSTRFLPVSLMFRSHILSITDETQLANTIPILKPKLTILNVDDVLSLDRISQLHLLLVPFLILPCYLRMQIKVQILPQFTRPAQK